jgi:predicted nucleic acid-binding protein
LSVVVDANLLIVLALNDSRAPAVDAKLREWGEQSEPMHAPHLLRYEAASALTRAVAAGQLTTDGLAAAWSHITRLPITLHTLDDGPTTIDLAARLGRQSAYDAAYLALAQALGADLWTLDGPLARNAGGLGLPVKLVEA